MISTQHDRRREKGLLTQKEVCERAEISASGFQYHLTRDLVEAPEGRLCSRFFYTEAQARRIEKYFKGRKPWQRLNGSQALNLLNELVEL